ncbi:DUF4255 domain-containing protein [bacterium]|nr:DUF4255 domain-containing protein [bacterium]MBU1754569.1 DUF4255 domain-containing protein [bacterium]
MFTILRDVNETLKVFFRKNISELSEENSITFDSPSNITTTSSPKLSVFLYHIIENTHLRNTEPTPIGLNQMQSPPLIVDLFYLFTPYAQSSETELIILEKVMCMFYDNAILKGEILREDLRKTGNNEIRVVSNNLTFEESNKLWERFPDKPFKLSASYILTPVRIPSGKKKTISRVIEKEIDMYLIEDKK